MWWCSSAEPHRYLSTNTAIFITMSVLLLGLLGSFRLEEFKQSKVSSSLWASCPLTLVSFQVRAVREWAASQGKHGFCTHARPSRGGWVAPSSRGEVQKSTKYKCYIVILPVSAQHMGKCPTMPTHAHCIPGYNLLHGDMIQMEAHLNISLITLRHQDLLISL